MAELRDIMATEFIPSRDAYHDAVDSGGPYTLTTTYAKYVNDAAVRNESTLVMWDEVASHVDCSMLPVGSKLDIKVDSVVAAQNKGAVMLVKFECPNGGAPFTLEEIPVEVASNAAQSERWVLIGYVGPEVQQYGIDIYSKVETGTADVSSRKLLVRA